MKHTLSILLLAASARALAQPAPPLTADPAPAAPPSPVPAPAAAPPPAPAATPEPGASPSALPGVPAPTTEPPPTVAKTPDLPAGGVSKSDKVDGSLKKLSLELKPGGYVQVDTRRQLNDAEAHELTIRRLRFKLDGTAGRYFKFRTLVDFAGSKLVVDDAWAEGVVRPELSIRAGKDKSQFGIERLQSATQLVFLERAYPTQLAPNRDIGVWLRGDVSSGLVHYAAGVVDGVADNAVIEAESDNHLEYNLHVLVSPLAQRKALGDLAIGGAATFGHTSGNQTTTGLSGIKSAAQATIVSYPANAMDAAKTATATGYRTRLAGHAYYYRGPAGALVEYVRDKEPVRLGDTVTATVNQAWQLATSVAVTPGDQPTYRSLKPMHPFDPSKGSYGAVEVGGRYAELRIDPQNFDAGIMKSTKTVERAREFTLGGNWYFNDYLKLQLDYTFTQFTGGGADGDRTHEHLIATRFQASI